jgi:uncharacterized iron-regulated membrane protein
MNDTGSAFYRRLPFARKLWLNLHLWLGLTAGVALALIGLTGSLLVFSVPMLKIELGSSRFAVDGPQVLSPAVDEAVMHPLHRYLMLGRFGQGIAFLAALLLPFSFVTGVLLWLNARKYRRHEL